MIYIIGGVSRAGKGVLGRRLAKHFNCSYIPLDVLFIAMHQGFPIAGVKGNQPDTEKADRMWKFHKAMIDYLVYENAVDYVLDGVTILPSQASKLMKKYPNKIKSIFLGYDSTTVEHKFKAVRKNHGQFPNDWLEEKKDVYVASHIKSNIKRSHEYKTSCEKLGLSYVDMSYDFDKQHDKAFKYMIGK